MIILRIPERDVRPTICCPAEPAAHDEHLEPGISGGARMHFRKRLVAALSGAAPWEASFEEEAERLQLNAPLGPMPPPPKLERHCPDGLLADITEDFVPDLGVMGERITGNPEQPLTTPLAAAMLYVPTLEEGRRALDLWSREVGDRGLKLAVRALDRAPPWVYQGDQAVAWGTAQIQGPDCWVGRFYIGPQGPTRSAAFALPEGLSLRPLWRRLQGELWRLRLLQPEVGLYELLHMRPELMYRPVLEAAGA